jgi:hypothetical protein
MPDDDGSKPKRRRLPATVHGATGCAGETAGPGVDGDGH